MRSAVPCAAQRGRPLALVCQNRPRPVFLPGLAAPLVGAPPVVRVIQSHVSNPARAWCESQCETRGQAVCGGGGDGWPRCGCRGRGGAVVLAQVVVPFKGAAATSENRICQHAAALGVG